MMREKNYLSNSPDKYDGLFVSANVLESFPKALANFVYFLSKPYVIDPVTYVFGPAPINYAGRRWWADLLDAFGANQILPPGVSGFSPEQLIDPSGRATPNLELFVRKVIDYQKSRIRAIALSIREIREFMQAMGGPVNEKPQFLVAPYFFMPSASNRWAIVNRESIRLAVAHKGTYQLYGVLFIDKSLLGFPDELERMIQLLSISELDGYIVWIADFRETEAPEGLLRGFRSFVERLRTLNKPIINMYGGLFSYLLEASGIAGVSHSICYGESKDPFTEGGGFFVRYYHPRMRDKIPAGKIQVFWSLRPDHRCTCPVCAAIVSAAQSWEDITIEQAALHFLNIRSEELAKIDGGNRQEIITDFSNAEQQIRPLDPTGSLEQFYSHLSKWVQVL
jgi:hypothetical protein